MRFTEEMVEKINNNIKDKAGEKMLQVANSIGEAHVFDGSWGVCNVDELSECIRALTIVKKAIEEETGAIF